MRILLVNNLYAPNMVGGAEHSVQDLAEPFGRVVIEAYAHGVPVIVSNRGGLPEIVEEGRTGHIFEPDDPSALRSLLERFVEQPELARLMAPDCLNKSRDFLSKHIAEKYIEIYTRLIDFSGAA